MKNLTEEMLMMGSRVWKTAKSFLDTFEVFVEDDAKIIESTQQQLRLKTS